MPIPVPMRMVVLAALGVLLSSCGGSSEMGEPGPSTSAASGAGSRSVVAMATAPKPNVTVTVEPTATHAISPYIYGFNSYAKYPGAPTGLTLDRAGGDRWTAYNWQTNASNAGSDFHYSSDDYLSSSTIPAEAVRSRIAGDQALQMASLVTFQLQGLVAADEAGTVSVANPPDLVRFKYVVDQKSTASNAPFTTTPPDTDRNVFMDEFLWALNQKFPGQSIFGLTPLAQPTFVELDNEPELWNTTHLEVQGHAPVTSDAYISKTITLAKALKDQFPDLIIFGPVNYGFEGIYDWKGELAATPSGANWFPDKYLPAIKAASTSYGRPLVDVYDFHWYSNATDGYGHSVMSLTGATLSFSEVQAIVQSPRSLWDTSYTEKSWITSKYWLDGPIYMLGRLSARIASENPGMRLAITEYGNGGTNHIAGTLALADDLGIFGSQNLFAATYWPSTSSEPYPVAGFRVFRDFDGAGSNFGDTSVNAASSNVAVVAAYVSTDTTRPGRVVMVLINRSTATQLTAIDGQPLKGVAHLYRITATTAKGQAPIRPVLVGTVSASGSSLTVSLPELSVTTIDVY